MFAFFDSVAAIFQTVVNFVVGLVEMIMLGIFSQLFAWILEEGATLLSWMLDKPILMIAMGLFFCGAIIAFLMRIYHSV